MSNTLVWPIAYLKDPVFSLLRPLADENSIPLPVSEYFQAQARRLGGKSRVLRELHHLTVIAEDPSLQTFFENPFSCTIDLTILANPLKSFLKSCFTKNPNDPWASYKEEEKIKLSLSEEELIAQKQTLSDKEKQKIMKQQSQKFSWQELLALASERDGSIEKVYDFLLDTGLKEGQGHHGEEEPTLAEIVFSPSKDLVEIKLDPDETFKVVEIPVLLGRHYLSSKTQRIWFNENPSRKERFQKLMGTYAKWDTARLVVFKDDFSLAKNQFLLSRALAAYGLRLFGPWKSRLSLQKVPVHFSLLLDRSFPLDHFYLSDWDFNVGSLSIDAAFPEETQLEAIA
jgi:hypothetical protein